MYGRAELDRLLPFHNEKSPSFFVYDDRFHCFGCGAHGDAIGFVMQSEGAAFIEAVERLAGEAGLEVPKASPAAAAMEQQRATLTEVLEAAAASFVRRLHAPEGRDALAYLRNRGLTDETIRRFGLGWSGEGGARWSPNSASSASTRRAWPRLGCCRGRRGSRRASCSTTG